MNKQLIQLPTLFPETLSISRDFTVFSSCEYKWLLERCFHFFKYVENTDLEAGGEFASSTEIARLAYYRDGKTIEDAIELGFQHMLESYGATYANMSYKSDLKTPERMAQVFKDMHNEQPMDGATIVPFAMEDGSVSVEQDFSVELPILHPDTGKPIILKGILDLLGMRGPIVFGVDEKTCKSVLEDVIKQTNLLRTSSQFVCYTNLVNNYMRRIGGQELTHFRVNKCKVKKSYTKTESVVESYEFLIDLWFQETWWDNMLYIVQDMVDKYVRLRDNIAAYKDCLETKFPETAEKFLRAVVFPRNYGHGCTLFFKPCIFTDHCTSGVHQDLFAEGLKQVVCNSQTKGAAIPLHDWRKVVFGEATLEEVTPLPVEIVEAEPIENVEDFLNTFY